MGEFRVVVDGRVLAGFDPAQVRVNLARLTRQDAVTVDRLLAGRAVTVKANVDAASGERYLSTLRDIGVACHLESETLEFDALIVPGNSTLEFDLDIVPGNGAPVATERRSTLPAMTPRAPGLLRPGSKGWFMGLAVVLLVGIVVGGVGVIGERTSLPISFTTLFGTRLPQCSSGETIALVKQDLAKRMAHQFDPDTRGQRRLRRAQEAAAFSVTQVRTDHQNQAGHTVYCTATLTAHLLPLPNNADQSVLEDIFTLGKDAKLQQQGDSAVANLAYAVERTDQGELRLQVGQGADPLTSLVALHGGAYGDAAPAAPPNPTAVATQALGAAGAARVQAPVPDSPNPREFLGDFTDRAALATLYGDYDDQRGIAIWPDVHLPLASPGAALLNGKAALVRAAGSAEYTSDGGVKRMLVTAASPTVEGGYTCHACAPLVGIAIFGRTETGWRVETEIRDLTLWGAFGNIGMPQWLQVGRNRYGLALMSADMHQGNGDAVVQVFAQKDNNFVRVFEYSDSGDGEIAFEISALQGNDIEHFDLKVVETRPDSSGAQGNTTHVFEYRGGTYVEVRAG